MSKSVRRKMKLIVAFKVVLLILVGSLSALARPYPNELRGYEFFGRGKLAKVRLGESTHADIRKIFGESCNYVCVLDEKWFINFSFVGEHSSAEVHDETLEPRQEFLGKLYDIELQPNGSSRIVSRSRFSKAFKMSRAWSSVSEVGEWSEWRVHSDNYGLSYSTCIKSSYACRRDELLSIEYKPSKSLFARMFTKKRDTK